MQWGEDSLLERVTGSDGTEILYIVEMKRHFDTIQVYATAPLTL